MIKYYIPHAIIDGGKVILLAEDELNWPSEMDLFNCVLNQGQVNSLLSKISKKYQGIKGPVLASITI